MATDRRSCTIGYMTTLALNEAAARYMTTLTIIEGALVTSRTVYRFMDTDRYMALLQSSPAEGMRIYWTELLFRAHMGAATAILRQAEWLRAVGAASAQQNLFGMAASLRSLVESGADIHDGLAQVPEALARSQEEILRSLSGEPGPKVFAGELEDKLIHFAFARRVRRGEAPENHENKTSAEYVRSIEQSGSKAMAEFYGYLCEITHPAASSIHCFLGEVGEDILLYPQRSKLIAGATLEKYSPEILRALQLGCNPPLLTLKVLQRLHLAFLDCSFMSEIDVSGIGGWKKLDPLLPPEARPAV